ncbi:MAG TPA: hypothetical protein P5136_03835 [Methanofastidiosum sp.]|nr:hypothetical protein [Methanofastidiosum sp.]
MVKEGFEELSKAVEVNVEQFTKSVESVIPAINRVYESYRSSMKELNRITTTLAEHFKYNKLVPPQVFDFLVKMGVPLSKEEISELQKLETNENRKLFKIYTRKTKGKKIYNPQFYVNEDLCDAISLLMVRNGSAVSVKNSIVYFDAKTGALDVYGMVTYMKKDSDRYKLCNFLFGKKRGPREWEVEDIVLALTDGVRKFNPKKKKKSYDWVNGKITELNKDVSDSIGIDELVSYEGGRFVLNSVNRI